MDCGAEFLLDVADAVVESQLVSWIQTSLFLLVLDWKEGLLGGHMRGELTYKRTGLSMAWSVRLGVDVVGDIGVLTHSSFRHD